ncbi:MAG: hypothetical protein M3R39_08645 [Actinomycetota bacterium]|nr:hypothetical protein [Actinomycetota bacterium]
MHEDDVDTCKGLAILDGLLGDLADVRDAFQLELARLDAPAATAQVAGDQPLLLLVKGAVHGDGRFRRSLGRRRVATGFLGAREEGRVALDLDQLEVRRGVDHRFEETSDVGLGVSEAQTVQAHVLRVAPDVRDQQEGSGFSHRQDGSWTSTS